MKIYTVRACRWGVHDKHSYIVGVYSKKKLARKAAAIEEDYRGGKYDCEILEWELNEGTEGRMSAPYMKTIKKLESKYLGKS